MKTLQQYTAEWEENILLLKRPATINTFRGHIRRLNEGLGGFYLKDITEQRVQKHLNSFQGILSPRTIKNYWGTVRLILNRAKRDGLINIVPNPELQKVMKTQQPWFTLEQMKCIIEASKYQEDYRFFYLMAETGLRIGEAVGLKIRDIDFKNQTLSIKRSSYNGKEQEPKTQNAFRTISLSKKLTALLALQSEERYDTIGSINLDASLFDATNITWGKRLHGILDAFGIERTGFHAFRRGNATVCANILGMPEKIIAYRLGHAAPGITLGLYAQNIVGQDHDWAEKIGELLP